MKFRLLQNKRNFIGISIFLAIVSPVVILAFFSYKNSKQEIINFTLAQKSSLARLTAITLKERFDRMKDLSISLSTRVKMRQLISEGKWKEASQILAAVPRDFPFINRILLANPRGVLMADIPHAPEVQGMSFAHRDWYKGVMKTKKPYVSEIYTRTAQPSYNVVAFATPIQSEKGSFLGILVLQITLDTFLEWSKTVEAGPEALIYFLDNRGQLAGHPMFAAQGKIIDYSQNPVTHKILQGKGGAELLFSKEKQIVAYEPVPEYHWGVVVEQPLRVAFDTFSSNLRHAFSVYGAIFVLSCVCAYLILWGINRRKRAEEENRNFFTLSPDMLCIAGFDGYFKKLNPSWEKTLGFTIEELCAKPFLEFIHPEDREKTIAEAGKLATGIETISFENRYLCKDGSYKWMLWNSTPSLEGQLIYANARDITERKQLEETLRDSEQRYRLLFDENPIPAWVFDLETLSFLAVNRAAIRHYGYSREEFLSLTIKDIRPEEDIPALLERISQLKEGAHPPGQWRHRKKDGGIIDVEVISHPLTFGGREAELVLANDITERKQAEAELHKLNESLKYYSTQLEAANKELESFSYSVSHDLRAPLRSIDGFSLAIMEDYANKLDEEGKKNLERVRAGCKRMSQLIDDMLNLSRLARAEMRLEKVDLTALAQEIAEELKKIQPERKVNFNIKEGLFAQGDLRLLKAVLENLLNNAWKYTSKHPTANIAFNASQQNGKTVFYVKDDGVGFDMKYADKLFGVFQRLHRMDEFEGNGVGLATVKRVIHRHGGEVWAEGEVDKGATFYFTL